MDFRLREICPLSHEGLHYIQLQLASFFVGQHCLLQMNGLLERSEVHFEEREGIKIGIWNDDGV